MLFLNQLLAGSLVRILHSRAMFRTSLIATFILVAAVACSDGASDGQPDPQNGISGPPVTPVERPASVPADAEELRENTTLGSIERVAGQQPQGNDTRTLLTAECQGDVMLLATDRETIHAAIPCDRFWDDETGERFSGEEVALRLTVDATRFQIFIETLAGAQAEFTVEGTWIE